MSDNEKQEKVVEVLKLFQKGLPVEEVAQAVGYHHKSLSRFMNSQGYKWDRQINNYILDVDSEVHRESPDVRESEKKDSKKKEAKGKEPVEEQSETHSEDVDVFDLLETEDVVILLKNAKEIIKLLSTRPDTPIASNEVHEENIWRMAQKYNRSHSPSISKTIRIPVELEVELSNFCNSTGLNQKQVICLAIEQLLDRNVGVNNGTGTD